MEQFLDITILLPVIAVLTAITNILVEVLKESSTFRAIKMARRYSDKRTNATSS